MKRIVGPLLIKQNFPWYIYDSDYREEWKYLWTYLLTLILCFWCFSCVFLTLFLFLSYLNFLAFRNFLIPGMLNLFFWVNYDNLTDEYIFLNFPTFCFEIVFTCFLLQWNWNTIFKCLEKKRFKKILKKCEK